MHHNRSAAVLVGVCAALVSCNSPATDDLTAPQDPAVTPFARGSNSILAPSDTWTAKPQLPVARYGHNAVTVNGIIYVVGGRSGTFVTVTLARVDAFNLATSTWSRRASMPGPRWEPDGASVINGRIYVSGGEDANDRQTKTLFVYNPGTDTWVRKADMPRAASCGTQGVIAGLLYVSTGCISSTKAPGFYRYNPTTNTWTTLPSPPATHEFGVAGVLGGKFYLTGGFDPALDVFDPATMRWTRMASTPHGLPFMSSAVLNGKLLVAGGDDADAGEATPDKELVRGLRVYDPTTDTWHFRAPMPAPRVDGAGVAAAGLFFVMGGFTNFQSETRSVIAYQP
jgi:N-acetylneuraminic acid mutarotase